MEKRERILTTLRRIEPDRVPIELNLSKELFELFNKETGSMDVNQYFKIGMKQVQFKPTQENKNFSNYIHPLPGDINIDMWSQRIHAGHIPDKVLTIPKSRYIDEWGIGLELGSKFHFFKIIHPMSSLTDAYQLEDYPFPNLTSRYRYNHLRKEVKELKASGYAVSTASTTATIFETAWWLRGFENLMEDFIYNKKFAQKLLDKITDIRCFMVTEFAKADVDILKLGDDVGSQRGLIMSPEMWRYWLKPRISKIINISKKIKQNILVYYHSDGDIEAIIPDLIEIGVDILNPVQPECMDPIKLKLKYGHELAFWGTLGAQTTMSFGSNNEIRDKVKELIFNVGQGGGLLLAPCHVLGPEVPWKNIMTFIETVDKYGSYPLKIY